MNKAKVDNLEELPPLTRSLQGILRGRKNPEKDYKKYLKDKATVYSVRERSEATPS